MKDKRGRRSLTSFIFNTRLPLHSPSRREFLTPQLCCANPRHAGCQEPRCNSRHLQFQKGPCAWAVPGEQRGIPCTLYLQQATSSLSTQAAISPAHLAEQQRGQGSTELREGENQAPARSKICMVVIKMFGGYFCFSLEKASCF